MTGLVLILGLGEPASVAARVLARAGYSVALATDAAPCAHRRLMAFSDAWWDGEARLCGARAAMAEPGEVLPYGVIPIHRLALAQAVQALFVSVLPCKRAGLPKAAEHGPRWVLSMPASWPAWGLLTLPERYRAPVGRVHVTRKSRHLQISTTSETRPPTAQSSKFRRRNVGAIFRGALQ